MCRFCEKGEHLTADSCIDNEIQNVEMSILKGVWHIVRHNKNGQTVTTDIPVRFCPVCGAGVVAVPNGEEDV